MMNLPPAAATRDIEARERIISREETAIKTERSILKAALEARAKILSPSQPKVANGRPAKALNETVYYKAVEAGDAQRAEHCLQNAKMKLKHMGFSWHDFGNMSDLEIVEESNAARRKSACNDALAHSVSVHAEGNEGLLASLTASIDEAAEFDFTALISERQQALQKRAATLEEMRLALRAAIKQARTIARKESTPCRTAKAKRCRKTKATANTSPNGLAFGVNPYELQVIARITELFLLGMRPKSIARKLTAEGLKGRGATWHHNAIKRILQRAGATIAPYVAPKA